jgi:hypothetical protein
MPVLRIRFTSADLTRTRLAPTAGVRSTATRAVDIGDLYRRTGPMPRERLFLPKNQRWILLVGTAEGRTTTELAQRPHPAPIGAAQRHRTRIGRAANRPTRPPPTRPPPTRPPSTRPPSTRPTRPGALPWLRHAKPSTGPRVAPHSSKSRSGTAAPAGGATRARRSTASAQDGRRASPVVRAQMAPLGSEPLRHQSLSDFAMTPRPDRPPW